VSAGGQRGTLLRPGILVAIAMIAAAGAYLWWIHLHQPEELWSTLPFAGLLVLFGVVALVAELAPPFASVAVTAGLITVLLAVGYAALMSLGIALIALAVVEAALVLRPLQRLSTRHAIASLALGCLVGAVVDAGFFNWAAYSN
jgi:hypothetical protein